ncbi:MAG: prephenate dehydrogenase/arogenate dehydrogenase family protein, partial [Bacteroidia bacterium]|nr:prephenate dehydrogenase/arogenate dehydrogenase family protein [Bacteroidia bacterium]
MKTTIIGLGLIGGSVALDLRKARFSTELIGVDLNPDHALKAVELGIVDKTLTEDKALAWADLVILAIPVNAASAFLSSILDT